MVRMVRIGKGTPAEERLPAVRLLFQELYDPIGDPTAVVQFSRYMRWACRLPVGLFPCAPFLNGPYDLGSHSLQPVGVIPPDEIAMPTDAEGAL